jgi:hypothetical protein
MLNHPERLRQLLAAERERLRATFPFDREQALIAITRARDAWYLAAETSPGQPTEGEDRTRWFGLGWNRALQLALEATAEAPSLAPALPGTQMDAWADEVIPACGRLGEAELVLAQAESGYVQLHPSGERAFDAWVATRRMPTEWREREDFAWWTDALARRVAPDLDELLAARPELARRLQSLAPPGETPADLATTAPLVDDYYRQLGRVFVRRMANQSSYPPEASIGGATFQLYLDLLVLLIGWLLKQLDRVAALGEPELGASARRPGLAMPQSEEALVETIAAALAIDAGLARQAIRSWTLDPDNAAYHAALPGSPAPPFIRLDEGRLLWSAAGLLTAPVLFLMRELKRRHARAYHDAAHLREDVFRQDLYRLFEDRRFVTSTSRLELRRAGGDARTDLDALIFDRKSGSLGVFELKAQDPFSRSPAERQRQRDNFFHANQQIAAVAQWVQRNDATSLLARIDPRAARTFRVQRVYLFVLGRYVAHFADGPTPDRRAAWGTWPQVLRLVGERPFSPTDANPLGLLHARLVQDTPLRPAVAEPPVREIALGVGRVRVYPSFAAYKRANG